MQEALFEQQPVVGPASRHFCRAFIASVSVRVSPGCVESTVLYMHQDTRPYMYRQTDRQSGWISELVAAHTLAHAVHTRTPLRCGRAAVGTCMHTCMCVRAYLFPFLSVKTQSYLCFTNVCERICFLFVHFYERARQLSARTRAHMQRSRPHP